MRRFGQKVATLRKRHHMTQKRLADELGGMTATYISKIENGKEEPSLKFVLKISELFQVSMDQLTKDDLEVE